MSRYKTDPTQPNFWLWHARATVRMVTARVVAWQCTSCKTDNRIIQLPGGRRRSSPYHLRAKCGRCHGRYLTLITLDDREISPTL